MLEAVLVSAWLCAGQLIFDTKIYTEDGYILDLC